MTDEATSESRRIWDGVAPAWERHRVFLLEGTRAVSERLVEAIGRREGDTILELTAEPGIRGSWPRRDCRRLASSSPTSLRHGPCRRESGP